MPRGQSRTKGRPSAADIQSALHGVKYPASKDDLIDAGEDNRASEEILDMIDGLPDEEFGGPQDVQEMIFGDHSSGSRRSGRSNSSTGGESREKQVEHHIIDILHDEGEVSEADLCDHLDEDGFKENEVMDALELLEKEGICEEDEGNWKLMEDRISLRRRNREARRSGGEQSSSRASDRQQPRSSSRPSSRRSQSEDPDPGRVSSVRRSNADLSQAEEEYNRRQEMNEGREESDYDRRLRGHATDKIADGRAMRHGYDGRGRVTNPETDGRLGDHPTQAIDDARHMRNGYDGRGRVRKRGPGTEQEADNDFHSYLENKRKNSGNSASDRRGGSSSSRRS